MEDGLILPYLDIPFQHASPKILKSMKRPGKIDNVLQRIKSWREICPDLAIRSTFIVGFPGESNEEFIDSYTFINELDISYLHVFTYSERANTHAIELGDVVPNSIRAERSKMLHILSEKKKRFFYEQQKGKSKKVLWEGEQDGEWMYGFTENYIKVKTPFLMKNTNTVQHILLEELDTEGIFTIQ
jgi:threonylcarbamoyladenosine tRNA methylthiotransferase MtaB